MQSSDQNHQENLDRLPYMMEHVQSTCYNILHSRYRLNDFTLMYMMIHHTNTFVTEIFKQVVNENNDLLERIW